MEPVKPVYHLNLAKEKQVMTDNLVGFQFYFLMIAFSLVALGGIAYRYEAIKNALGL